MQKVIKWFKRLFKKKCHDDCGKCVWLGSVWTGYKFRGLYCKKGYW